MLYCSICKKRLKQDDKVIPIAKVIENEKRGDFISEGNEFACISHFRNT